MGAVKYKPLGMRLIEAGLINQEQLELALKRQKRTGEFLGEALYNLGFVTQKDISTVLAQEAGVEHIDMDHYLVDTEALKLVPESFARANKLIPISLLGNILTVAMANTMDVVTVDKLQRITSSFVETLSADETDILQAIDKFYNSVNLIDQMIEESIRQAQSKALTKEDTVLIGEAPVVKLVDQLIAKGVSERATDIHLEPDDSILKVRYRIDGILHQVPSLPKVLHSPVISRLKVMSDLNISEQRIPQDGRCKFSIGNKRIDLRVSTFPTIFGEKLVLRVLDREMLILGLENLGFFIQNLKVFKKVIQQPQGIILVTGPTGSGKTTTLYSTLDYLNSMERNIITLEDPVEYELNNINQCQINPKAGLTFASGLRSILRQDPDVIFVGEMRDTETAEMAVRASLTGHLVLSTLHTNDAAGAIPRIRDMGIKPFLIASSLIAVVAQRLVRVICSHCKKPWKDSTTFLKRLGINGKWADREFYKGVGCEKCYDSGYRGRVALFEILRLTPTIAKLIMQETDSLTIKATARKEGMRTLIEDGFTKAAAGTTTLEEVLRTGSNNGYFH